MKRRIGRPRKDAGASKGELLQVRVDTNEKLGFTEAADSRASRLGLG